MPQAAGVYKLIRLITKERGEEVAMKQPRCLGARLASGLLLARGPPAPSRPSGETPVLPQPLRLKPPRRRRSLACSRRAATPRPNRARRPPYPPPPQRLGPPRRLAKQREELRARLTCRKRARVLAPVPAKATFGPSATPCPPRPRTPAATPRPIPGLGRRGRRRQAEARARRWRTARGRQRQAACPAVEYGNG